MFISVEQTVDQTLPKSVVSACNQVTITHLPGNSLTATVDTVKKIHDQAGVPVAVPHIAARNLQTEAELINACIAFAEEGVKTVLIVGGNSKKGPVYSSVYQICNVLKDFQFRKICGIYPQQETPKQVKDKKLSNFSQGITQFCLKPSLLRPFADSSLIGVPSECSTRALLKYAKLCGIANSAKTAVQNLQGVRFLTLTGFDTARFVSSIGCNSIHIYNFGKIESTVRSLAK